MIYIYNKKFSVISNTIFWNYGRFFWYRKKFFKKKYVWDKCPFEKKFKLGKDVQYLFAKWPPHDHRNNRLMAASWPRRIKLNGIRCSATRELSVVALINSGITKFGALLQLSFSGTVSQPNISKHLSMLVHQSTNCILNSMELSGVTCLRHLTVL